MRTTPSLLAFTVLALATGCGTGSKTADGPPHLALGEATCVTCGMTVADPLYAAMSRDGTGELRVYDSIECLIMDHRRPGAQGDRKIWLPDHANGGAWHVSRDMTVVLADYPSPMGKGYAAFADPVRAEREAEARRGLSGPLDGFIDGSLKNSRQRP